MTRRSPSRRPAPAPRSRAAGADDERDAASGAQRLQKILSQAGVASRRTAESLIVQGRITVNGAPIHELGTKADPERDDIRVDGRRLRSAERKRYLLLYKPAGYVTTRSDPQRRPTVIDLLGGVREYVYPVGRLDYDTEGLLLLTNDGDLAAALTHPRHGVGRTYEARVSGMPDERALTRLRDGIPLDGQRTLPAEITLLNPGHRENGVLRIMIREGRNRQVRRMCEAVGHPVQTLKRTRFGSLGDRRLKSGQWRDLDEEEVAALRREIRRTEREVSTGTGAAARKRAPAREPRPARTPRGRSR